MPRARRRRRRGRRARPAALAVHDAGRLDRRPRARPAARSRAPTPSCTPRRCTSPTSARIRARTFVDTNVTGTLTLLEEAVAAGVGRFVFTSTTSAFGRALTPPPGAPAAWVTEDVAPVPRNIYGVTKTAAEDVCELVHRDHGLPVVILRTSRFFPEPDDRDEVRAALPRRQPEGQRAALPARRPRGRRQRAPLRARARRRHRLRPLHRQRHHAVHAATTSPSCTRDARPVVARHAPALRGPLRAAGLADVRRDRARLRQRRRPPRPRLGAEVRLRLCARASRGGRGVALRRWRWPSARRATTPRRPGSTPCARSGEARRYACRGRQPPAPRSTHAAHGQSHASRARCGPRGVPLARLGSRGRRGARDGSRRDRARAGKPPSSVSSSRPAPGWRRITSNSSSVSVPGLSRIAPGTASLPMSCSRPPSASRRRRSPGGRAARPACAPPASRRGRLRPRGTSSARRSISACTRPPRKVSSSATRSAAAGRRSAAARPSSGAGRRADRSPSRRCRCRPQGVATVSPSAAVGGAVGTSSGTYELELARRPTAGVRAAARPRMARGDEDRCRTRCPPGSPPA